MDAPVRVRFAPSPTGYLHVGGLRTALYNYLFARKHGGTFVLRIEDTDQSRYVEGAEESLLRSLRWAGLQYDEGPDVGGKYGPYRQSERLALYQEAAEELLRAGHAYRCYRTPEELEQLREEHQKSKNPNRLDVRLPREESERRAASGMPSVVRLLVPDGETIAFEDLVRGPVAISSDIVDDQILLKSDGFPTYHLANVVDDHAMQISHVIRGEEWLPSVPKHLLLYRYLGFEPPRLAHLPLLLNSDRSKLSKRQGDVAVEDYRDKSFYPEALLNFVAFLGWNPGDDREIFSRDELVEAWSLERVNKSGAIFNLDKLAWFNQQYVRMRPDAELAEELRPHLAARNWDHFDTAYLAQVAQLMKERVTFVYEIPELAPYFFTEPTEYDADAVKKRWKPESGERLKVLSGAYSSLAEWHADELESTLQKTAETLAVGAGQLIHPTRLAVSGVGVGPSLYHLLEVLGRERCLVRIERAIESLG
ncbi:MAG: glutamate--tRNA ligase [Candidatus Eisenbacteria bacterium]|uniref:Glutamate--tRNA ligase n=1 Tax=Eiseniibacteriota bacterium TaxID=2212470 RepID=A0A956NC57_UNCEI|nr:glutamate--tRNA ligase [Candidatus Eisenbacteria bacterium]MCB9463838.1 glutamate--tRNA ligase [Candidatus Eisenbacteria bacterium]